MAIFRSLLPSHHGIIGCEKLKRYLRFTGSFRTCLPLRSTPTRKSESRSSVLWKDFSGNSKRCPKTPNWEKKWVSIFFTSWLKMMHCISLSLVLQWCDFFCFSWPYNFFPAFYVIAGLEHGFYYGSFFFSCFNSATVANHQWPYVIITVHSASDNGRHWIIIRGHCFLSFRRGWSEKHDVWWFPVVDVGRLGCWCYHVQVLQHFNQCKSAAEGKEKLCLVLLIRQWVLLMYLCTGEYPWQLHQVWRCYTKGLDV